MSITMFTSDNIPALVPMPGEFLLDFLSERKRSQRKLAGIIDKTPTEINDIIKGRKSINADFAVRFGIAFGTSAELRLNMQI